MSRTAQRARWVQRVVRFMDDPTAEDFGELALALHQWQRQHDPVINALTVHTPDRWRDIPCVPVALFKQLPVGTVPADVDATIFRTSGTTGGGRGEHRMVDTRVYDHGAVAHYRRCVPDAPTRIVALLSDPTLTPDSSLSHMVRLFASPHQTSWHWNDAVDRSGLEDALAVGQPVFVATTAFALAEWLDGPVPKLPAGSVVMTTGGFKGRVHRLEGDVLYAEARARLKPHRLVTEYGMTELSSQLWGTPDTAYRPPHWMRVVAVDPASGEPCGPDQPGQLRFFDLANVDSTIGIETMDQGVVHADGTVTLHGRLQGAPARGCSLTVEEAWQKR